MPELPTYTATGNIRPTPLQGPSIEGAMRPYAAVAGLAGEIGDAGTRLSMIAKDRNLAIEQKKKEDDLTWVTEATNGFLRTVGERLKEDGKPENLSPDAAEKFDLFTQDEIPKILASAPSKRAADDFKKRADSIAFQGWQDSSKLGENVRLDRIQNSNNQAALSLSEAYRSFSATAGPDVAATTVGPLLASQIASIDARYGETAPSVAAKMRMVLVEEMVTATAATNPEFARNIVATSRAPEETKLQLNGRIDAMQASALELGRSRFLRTLDEKINIAQQTGREIADIGKEDFKELFGKSWQVRYEAWEAERTKINRASELVRELVGNPLSLQEKLDKLRNSDNADDVNAATVAQPQLNRLAKQAFEDPSGYQDERDPDLILDAMVLDTLPPEGKQQFVADYLYKKRARQMSPEPGDPHPERYLNRSTWRSMSIAEADSRKRAFLAAGPDEKMMMLEEFERETGDPYLANKMWIDMIELGNEKIPITYRFASVINNLQTRKGFIDAQTNAKALEELPSESRAKYVSTLEKADSPYRKIVAGMYGQSGEGGQDLADLTDASINYARHMQKFAPNLSAEDATAKAMDNMITANYGFANVHGRVIPIARKRMFGGPDRTDAEIEDMSRRLTVALKEVPVQELQLENQMGGPLFPNIPLKPDPSKPEQMQIVRDYITRNGFWQIDESGEMLTLFVADGSESGIALRDKNGGLLTAKVDDIPTYMGMGKDMMVPFPIDQKEQAKDTYPLVDKTWWQSLLNIPVKTNWPIRPTWMGSGGR